MKEKRKVNSTLKITLTAGIILLCYALDIYAVNLPFIDYYGNKGGNYQECLKISDLPLMAKASVPPPLIMFVIDDSGSMSWETVCDEKDGKFDEEKRPVDVADKWKSQFAGYNKIYYNPAIKYDPWVGNNYTQAHKTNPKTDPNGNNKWDMKKKFAGIDGKEIKWAHWYMQDENKDIYLVNLAGRLKYYKVDVENGNHGKVKDLDSTNSIPTTFIKSFKEDGSVEELFEFKKDYEYHRQNFANWYQYYRKRIFSAKAALAEVINGIDEGRVGYYGIQGTVYKAVRDISDKNSKKALIDEICKMPIVGGTPLRTALQEVGNYYDAAATSRIGVSPFAPSQNPVECQRAYTILISDGYWNGGNPSGIGDEDNDGSDPTLADVAQYYYDADFSNLPDNVPSSVKDPSSKQHMVTYTISFGLSGSLTPKPECFEDPQECPANWPDPNSNFKHKIDDLYHAAANGRGEFIKANNAKDLAEAMTGFLGDIGEPPNSAAISFNTQQLEGSTHVYQAKSDYDMGTREWSGDVLSYKLDLTTGKIEKETDADGNLVGKAVWSARDELDAAVNWIDRQILTFNGNKKAVTFNGNNVSTLDQNIVRYLRGEKTNEAPNGLKLRARQHLLGDIIHASPIQQDGVVYVGANDGMMHAFDEENGKELFAYVPKLVHDNLADLAKTDYKHKFFVDGTTAISKISGETWLVGGLGKGGKGYYGINITDGKSISRKNPPPVWEFPLNADSDIGYSYSQVSTVRSNLKNKDIVTIFGNGYESESGKAVLYILKDDGTELTRIYTETEGQCNGLSTPVVIDADFNGTVDYVYAGDLLGNLWKFDLTSPNETEWDVAYEHKNKKAPLFQAKDVGGNPQPITSRPDIMNHPAGKGYFLVFGTGLYLQESDIQSTSKQTLYGIWDWGDAWGDISVEDSDKSFGAFTPARTLANINESSYFDGKAKAEMTLLQQTLDKQPETGWIETSKNEIDWFDPETYHNNGGAYTGGYHVGWYMDLAYTGERIVSQPQLRNGYAVVVSFMPGASQLCGTSPGKSVLYVLNASNGGMPDVLIFDTNGDGKISDNENEKDSIKSGLVLGGEFQTPALISTENKGIDSLILGPNDELLINGEMKGIHYWRYFK